MEIKIWIQKIFFLIACLNSKQICKDFSDDFNQLLKKINTLWNGKQKVFKKIEYLECQKKKCLRRDLEFHKLKNLLTK